MLHRSKLEDVLRRTQIVPRATFGSCRSFEISTAAVLQRSEVGRVYGDGMSNDQATRTERDSMGEMQVPINALYGASTARAVENFPIAKRPLPPAMIHAFGHLKAACAQANKDLGKLEPEIADAIIEAATEVADGLHDEHFPVDVYQTGSGTSTNMNANEVIANLANQKLSSGSARVDRVRAHRREPRA